MRNLENHLGKKTPIGGGNDLFAAKEIFGSLFDVLVTTTGKIGDDDVVLAHRASHFGNVCQGMRGFESGDDPLGVSQFAEGGEGLVVGSVSVFGPTDVLEVGVFGTDGGVVEAGAY